MMIRGIGGLAVVALVLASGCRTGSDPVTAQNPYAETPIRVLFQYEASDGVGQVQFNKRMPHGDDPRSRAQRFNFPAKVAFDPNTRHAVAFQLGASKLYGLLSLWDATKFTAVSAVHLAITPEHVNSVGNGRLVRISVQDPQTSAQLVELLLGDSPIDA